MIGTLNVTIGIRLPLKVGSFLSFGVACGSINVVPHTRQRGASSLALEPQVGQIIVGEVEEFSIILISGDYTSLPRINGRFSLMLFSLCISMNKIGYKIN